MMTYPQQIGMTIAVIAAFIADLILAIQYPLDPPEFKNAPKYMWRAYLINALILAVYVLVFGVPKS